MNSTARNEQKQRAFGVFRAAGIPLREDEADLIEIAAFGLENFRSEGACIATLVATERYSAKALYLQPGQTLPEHWHPPIGADPGKQETIRVVTGECFLVTEGPPSLHRSRVPEGKDPVYTCRNEMVFNPGEQITLAPDQKHWFQGGPEGTVVFSFSSTVRDTQDGFTDPAIVRKPIIRED